MNEDFRPKLIFYTVIYIFRQGKRSRRSGRLLRGLDPLVGRSSIFVLDIPLFAQTWTRLSELFFRTGTRVRNGTYRVLTYWYPRTKIFRNYLANL